MSYNPHFFLACFETLPQEEKAAVLGALLEALTRANMLWLARNQAPPLYLAGVPYKVEPPGRDDWQDIPETLRRGDGDCEDLATWRIAELRMGRGVEFGGSRLITQPEQAMPFVTSSVIKGEFTYHIRVKRGNGAIEDPSRNLGM